MFGVIAVFIPSVIGIKLFDYLRKGLSLKNTIYYYLIFLGLSWMISVSLGVSIFGTDSNLFNEMCNDSFVFAKFAGFNTLVNIILALLVEIIIKNVSFNISAEKNVLGKVKKDVKKKIKKSK